MDGVEVSAIGPGLVILLGVSRSDGSAEADFLARKAAALRIFADPAGRMNLSVKDVQGEVLAVSQFTLMADSSSGNRPGFSEAAPAEEAKALYERFTEGLAREGVSVLSGIFQADMIVTLANDGPVTVMLEKQGIGG